jgi:histidyl-tRNA synthetase
VIIIGEDEVNKNVIKLKNLKSGDQENITLNEAIKKINKNKIR